jgi:hypothetical protein
MTLISAKFWLQDNSIVAVHCGYAEALINESNRKGSSSLREEEAERQQQQQRKWNLKI